MHTFVNTLRGIRFFFIAMSKPLHTYNFRPINGIWTDTRENIGTLADFLSSKGLVIDDRMQFARIYDYDAGWCIIYRAQAGLVEVEEWKL